MGEENWEQHSTLTPEEASDYWRSVLLPQVHNLRFAMPVGIICPYGSTTPPDGWLSCDGEAYNEADYPELFAVVGTDFGANGAGTFRVPDLQNRFPYGQGAGHAFAETGGAETHTLTTAQIPAHQHRCIAGSLAFAIEGARGGPVGFGTGSNMSANANTAPAGGGGSHNNMPPYLAIWYIIKAL
jgi:microcystin-dependent protein